MGWSIGYDSRWNRDVGYGVPGFCDHPGCPRTIDRGLAHVCGGDPFGGEYGCGLYFCERHLLYAPVEDVYTQLCSRCANPVAMPPYPPKPEHPRWLHFKETDPSWEEWRNERKANSVRTETPENPLAIRQTQPATTETPVVEVLDHTPHSPPPDDLPQSTP